MKIKGDASTINGCGEFLLHSGLTLTESGHIPARHALSVEMSVKPFATIITANGGAAVRPPSLLRLSMR